MTAPSVQSVQQALADLGYDPGPIDGAAGPLTAKAVTLFQSDRGMSATGKLDSATVDAILAHTPKENSMFPTILQMIIGFLPGIPDDIALVEAEIKEIASTDTGQQKLQAALTFAKNIVGIIEKVLGVTA